MMQETTSNCQHSYLIPTNEIHYTIVHYVIITVMWPIVLMSDNMMYCGQCVWVTNVTVLLEYLIDENNLYSGDRSIRVFDMKSL